MPFFLEVRSGPQAGNRIRLELGRILRVGRTDRADVAFTEDSHMSSLHFSLGWDGAHCRVTDLNSRNGTFVNGIPIHSHELQNGDRVEIGRSSFIYLTQDDVGR